MMSKVRKYILALLKQHGTIRYNEHFYRNGNEALWSELCDKFGVEQNTGGENSPPLLVDDEVWRMERDGLVEKRELAAKMSDGENDYEIVLTQKGREHLAAI